MSGPDLKQLSSNWKKLQTKLDEDKKKKGGKQKPAKQSNGLKRKRVTSTKTPPSAVKKTKLARMGSSHSHSAALDNIDPAALTAAYGYSSTTSSPTHPADSINTGHHPTHKLGKFIALDCEMVGTGPPPHSDNVLARASLVNYHGEQLYDSYVLPPHGVDVKDYRTHVSGIKPQHLRKGYARPFAEVQADVARILDGRVLVGHALRNDLNALILSHPKRDLRDTSRYGKYRLESGGRPPALRKLAKSELGWEIQGGEHSSLVDARTAMALYQKEKKGFEEENRRTFGVRGRVVKKEKEKEKSPSLEVESDDGVEDDEEEDMELLEGEEDEDLGNDGAEASSKSGQPKAKKKRKKKKNTKRK